MAGVSKIQLFGLCYSCLKQKADPNIAEMKSVNDSLHFKRTDTDETFNILKGPLDCNCNHVIYLFECKQCYYRFPYVVRPSLGIEQITTNQPIEVLERNVLRKTWQL